MILAIQKAGGLGAPVVPTYGTSEDPWGGGQPW